MSGGETPTRVNVVLSQDSALYWELYEAFEARLRSLAYKTDIRAHVLPDVPDGDVLVGAGLPASLTLFDRHQAKVVVSTLVPRQALARPSLQPNVRAAAVYLDQPPERYIKLIRAVLPEAKRLGILYGAVSRQDRTEFQKAARAAGFDLRETDLGSEDNVVRALENLPDRQVLLVPPDPRVSSEQNVYPLLLATYQRGIPVIAFSAAYVKAGALAAVYSTAAQVGEQTADLIGLFLEKGRLAPTAQYPKAFDVSVNRHVAKSLGLTVPDEGELRRRLSRENGGGEP